MDSVPGPGRSSLGKKRQHFPVYLPGKFYGQRSLVDLSSWGQKSQPCLSDWAPHSFHIMPNRLLENLLRNIFFLADFLLTASALSGFIRTLDSLIERRFNLQYFPWLIGWTKLLYLLILCTYSFVVSSLSVGTFSMLSVIKNYIWDYEISVCFINKTVWSTFQRSIMYLLCVQHLWSLTLF